MNPGRVLIAASLVLLCNPLVKRGQTDARSADDLGVYQAVLAKIREAVHLGRRDGKPEPILTFDRTLTTCVPSKDPHKLGCFAGDDIDAVEGVSAIRQMRLFSSRVTPDGAKELAASYRARNREPQPFPGARLEGLIVVSREDREAFNRELSRTPRSVIFSVPAYSADGRALVYASFYCGSNCAHGWFFLLEQRDSSWWVLDLFELWIS